MYEQDTDHIKILLIEDNPGDARLFQEMMADAGVEIERADQLSTGLGQLANGNFDVIVLDLGLPDSQGMEALLKVHSRAPRVPIVVMTGLGDREAGLKAIQKGAQDYLVKGEAGSKKIRDTICYAIARMQGQMAMHDFAAIVEENPDGILIIGGNGTIRYVNPAIETIWGRGKEEFIGQPFAHAILVGESTEIEILRPGGEMRFAELRAVEVDWPEETISMVMVQDVTERRCIEEALETANSQLQEKDNRLVELTETTQRLIDALSSDFRKSLASIRESAANLADGQGGPITEKQAERLGLISNSAQDLARMIDDMLETSQLKADTLREDHRIGPAEQGVESDSRRKAA